MCGAVTRPLCSGRGGPGVGVATLEWAWPFQTWLWWAEPPLIGPRGCRSVPCAPPLVLEVQKAGTKGLGKSRWSQRSLTAGLGLLPCLQGVGAENLPVLRAAKGTKCKRGPSVSAASFRGPPARSTPRGPARPSPPSSLSSPHRNLISLSFSAQLTGLGLRSSLDTGDSLAVGKGWRKEVLGAQGGLASCCEPLVLEASQLTVLLLSSGC